MFTVVFFMVSGNLNELPDNISINNISTSSIPSWILHKIWI